MTALDSRHLVLVGLMGAGKSTVGARCADRLGRVQLDTDALVEAEAGRPVAAVFAEEGEAAFRARERRAVFVACDREPAVISCGGGAVLDAESRGRLRAAGVVVWLRAEPATLAGRVEADGGDRPLLAGAPAEARLRELGVERADAYAAAAHVVVDTDGLETDEVTALVLAEAVACAG